MLDFIFYISKMQLATLTLCKTLRKFHKYNNVQLLRDLWGVHCQSGLSALFFTGNQCHLCRLESQAQKMQRVLNFFSSRQFSPMFSLNPGIWSHNWLSKSLSRQRELRRGTSTCVLLQADAVECNAQSCTIYGPWTVYKKQCSLSERGMEDRWESFQSRKLSFRIIYAVMKMFPPWRKMAGSTNSHLYPNQKRRGWASCHNYSVSSSGSCGMFTLLSIRSVSKTV